MLASASDAIIIGFNVRPVGEARQVADREGVEIRTYSVIYKIVEELRVGDAGPARAGGGRGDRRHRRGPPDLPRLARSARSPARTSPTARSAAAPPCASCATAASSTPAGSARCAASRRTSARSQAGYECGITHRGLRRHQGRRRLRGRSRRGRSSASSSSSFVCLVEIHLHFPDNHSLKGKRKEIVSLKAQLQQRFGAAVVRDRSPRPLAARDASAALVGARGRRASPRPRRSSSATSSRSIRESVALRAGNALR